MIYFDNSSARQEWSPTDRFAAFREIFEEFNKCCAKNMYLDDYIAIDEILYPTRGVISFKTYNKDTPTKYGLSFRGLCSSSILTFIILCLHGKVSRSNWKWNKLLKAMSNMAIHWKVQAWISTTCPFLWLKGYSTKILLG